jgi:hypothetical protein
MVCHSSASAVEARQSARRRLSGTEGVRGETVARTVGRAGLDSSGTDEM